jgi:hypothetical protein
VDPARRAHSLPVALCAVKIRQPQKAAKRSVAAK